MLADRHVANHAGAGSDKGLGVDGRAHPVDRDKPRRRNELFRILRHFHVLAHAIHGASVSFVVSVKERETRHR